MNMFQTDSISADQLFKGLLYSFPVGKIDPIMPLGIGLLNSYSSGTEKKKPMIPPVFLTKLTQTKNMLLRAL